MKRFDFTWALWGKALLFVAASIAIFNILSNMEPITDSISNFLRILFPLFLGGAIAFFLNTPCNKLTGVFQRRKSSFLQKRAKGLSVLVIYLITLLIISLILSYVIPIISQNVTDLIEAIPAFWNAVYHWAINLDFGDFNEFFDIEEQIQSALNNFSVNDVIANLSSSLGSIGEFTIGLTSGVIQVFVGIIISIYTLLYKNAILAFIMRIVRVVVKEKTLGRVKFYVKETNRIFYKFVTTQFLDSCIVAVLATIVLSFIGVQYAVTLGIFLGISNMIPYFGSIFASIATMIITIFTGGLMQGIITIIALLILQQIDGNVIGPKLMGGVLKVNPILIILSISIGGAYFGVLGMFLAVPVAALIKIIFIELVELEEDKKLALERSIAKEVEKETVSEE